MSAVQQKEATINNVLENLGKVLSKTPRLLSYNSTEKGRHDCFPDICGKYFKTTFNKTLLDNCFWISNE